MAGTPNPRGQPRAAFDGDSLLKRKAGRLRIRSLDRSNHLSVGHDFEPLDWNDRLDIRPECEAGFRITRQVEFSARANSIRAEGQHGTGGGERVPLPERLDPCFVAEFSGDCDIEAAAAGNHSGGRICEGIGSGPEMALRMPLFKLRYQSSMVASSIALLITSRASTDPRATSTGNSRIPIKAVPSKLGRPAGCT